MGTAPYSDYSSDVQAPVLVAPAARPIRLPALTGTNLVVGGPSRLMGWNLRETTKAAAAQIDFFDGNANSSQLVGTIQLNPAESVRDWFPPQGIEVSQLTAIVVSGSVDGVVYVVLE